MNSLSNDFFMKFLEDATDHRKQILHDLCERFLVLYEADEVDEMELIDGAKSAANQLKEVFSAMIVLLNPKPGHLKTDMSAVSAILKSKEQNGLVASFKLFLKGGSWQELLDDCLQKGAATLQLSPVLGELTSSLVDETKEDSPPCHVTKSLVTCVQKLPQLRKELRKGATKNLEMVLEQRLSTIAEHTLSLNQESVRTLPDDHLPVLMTALELTATSSKAMEKLMQQMKDWKGGMAGALQKLRLSSLVSALSTDPSKDIPWSEVKELADGLSSMKDEEDVQKCFRDVCQLLLSDLAEQVRLECLWERTTRTTDYRVCGS